MTLGLAPDETGANHESSINDHSHYRPYPGNPLEIRNTSTSRPQSAPAKPSVLKFGRGHSTRWLRTPSSHDRAHRSRSYYSESPEGPSLRPRTLRLPRAGQRTPPQQIVVSSLSLLQMNNPGFGGSSCTAARQRSQRRCRAERGSSSQKDANLSKNRTESDRRDFKAFRTIGPSAHSQQAPPCRP
jgi:hypothetical protein